MTFYKFIKIKNKALSWKPSRYAKATPTLVRNDLSDQQSLNLATL